MQTVLPREEAVEAIFSKIFESKEACGRLKDVFQEHLEEENISGDSAGHFAEVLFHAYKNGDVTALLLELCGRSMFDLLREAYLIPKKFHGKAGANPVLLTDVDGNLLQEKKVSAREYTKFKETYEIHQCAPRSKVYLADGYDLVRSYEKGTKIVEKKENKSRGILILYALPDTCKICRFRKQHRAQLYITDRKQELKSKKSLMRSGCSCRFANLRRRCCITCRKWMVSCWHAGKR